MSGKTIEDAIGEILKGDAQKNALDLAGHIRAGEGAGDFSIGKLNEEDHSFWVAKKKGENVCCVLMNGSNPESFTVWVCGDDIGGRAGAAVDGQTKEAAWANVFFPCGSCGSGCSPESRRKTVFGKNFDDVCTAELGVAMQFENPDGDTLDFVKKIVDVRKSDIANCS